MELRELLERLVDAGVVDLDGSEFVPAWPLRGALDDLPQQLVRLDEALKESISMHRVPALPASASFVYEATEALPAEPAGRGGQRLWYRQQAEGVQEGERKVVREEREILELRIGWAGGADWTFQMAHAPFADGRLPVVCDPAEAESVAKLVAALDALGIIAPESESGRR